MRRPWLLIALVAVFARAEAAPAFVSDVRIAGGIGTVTVDERPWLTRDGGRTFRPLRPGLVDATVLADGLGYARDRRGRLWRSGDGGRTWRPTPVRDVLRYTATSTGAWVLRAREGRVWLARSEDGGQRWSTRRLRVGGDDGPAVDVAFADAADGVLTGLRPDGAPFLRVTRDGGRTWAARRVPCSVVGHKTGPIARWLASGTLWLVCVGSGGAGLEVHTSTDGGAHFRLRSRALPPGLGGSDVGRLGGRGHLTDFRAVSDRRAFMGFGYGYTISRDGGHVWRGLRHLPAAPDGGLGALSVDGRDRYLAAGGRLWKSPDAGAGWRRLRLAGS